MFSKLTPIGRLLVVLVIVGLVGGTLWYLNRNPELAEKIAPGTSSSTSNYTSSEPASVKVSDESPLKVSINTWSGYAPGLYYNNGLSSNTDCRYYKEYGLQVDFKLQDDFNASRESWKKGETDVLWATLDAFTTETEGLKQFEPVVFLQVDWSFGGDAVVVTRGINSISDLRGKKIACAEMAPSQSLLLWLLEAGDLKFSDITMVKVDNGQKAAELFKTGNVDAAVCWSPDDQDAVSKIPGSKVLVNTKKASNIIADVFVVKKSFLNNKENFDKLVAFAEGWFKASAEIRNNNSAKEKAIDITADAFGVARDFVSTGIDNAKFALLGDNLNFFDVNGNYKGVTAEALYNKMVRSYMSLGYTNENTPSYRSIVNTSVIKKVKLSAPEQQAEPEPVFSEPTDVEKTAPAFATKKLSITFDVNSYELDDDAKSTIDNQFVDIAKGMKNTRIRIEGNTDNTGNLQSNVQLSLQRANAVKNYLVEQYKFNSNRFITIGNGPNKPVSDNSTEKGRKKNRRTDFELINE